MTSGPAACLLLLAAGAASLGATGCGRGAPPAVATRGASGKATVTLEVAEVRSGPSAAAPVVARLPRGAEVTVGPRRGSFWQVPVKGSEAGWIASDAFEAAGDREAREKRSGGVEKFPAQPGRALEACPILLAPDYGAARWGELADGEDVDVILFDHDFFGVRLPGLGLAFVPARAIRLLPSEAFDGDPLARRSPGRRRGPVPVIAPEPDEEADEPSGEVPIEAREIVAPPRVEPPELVRAPEPRYPDAARRMGIGGEVVLRIVVEVDGSVGEVEVIRSGPAGLTEAAIDAVKLRRYRPGRVDGQAAAMTVQVRVSFSLSGG